MIGEFGAYFAGIATGFPVYWRIYRRMCRRLVSNQRHEKIAESLELRRYATEFDYQDEPRPGAGPEGVERGLFSTRPGALMLSHLAEKNREKG